LANLRQIEFAGKTLLTPQCTLARSPNGGWDGKGFGMWHELQVAYGVWGMYAWEKEWKCLCKQFKSRVKLAGWRLVWGEVSRWKRKRWPQVQPKPTVRNVAISMLNVI